jgi:rhodanese-related sulfurtransferase
MNKKMIVAIIAVLIVVFAGLWLRNNQAKDSSVEMLKNSNKEDVTQISHYIDLDAGKSYELLINNSEAVILDVSPRFDNGHLPGAVNYYIGDGSLDKAIPSLDKKKIYLVYCHVDSASIPGAQKLVDAGFLKVYRLKGNYSSWLSGGYPIEVEIKAVGNYSGTALAERSYLGGKFKHSVKAKIADPAAGKFYEGWLVEGTQFFSTGKMEKQADQYLLGYESDKDSRDYKKIVITEETEAQGLDGKPEAHVLEGKFE